MVAERVPTCPECRAPLDQVGPKGAVCKRGHVVPRDELGRLPAGDGSMVEAASTPLPTARRNGHGLPKDAKSAKYPQERQPVGVGVLPEVGALRAELVRLDQVEREW